MIVIAIIGILAGVATTNYNRYKLKARQAEAKALMTDVYTNMKNYRASYDCYTSRLDAIGFNPAGELNYKVGFSADTPPVVGIFPEVSGTATCINTSPAGSPATACLQITPQWTNSDAVTSLVNFGVSQPWNEMFAVLAMSKNSSLSVDSWSLDENKIFKGRETADIPP